MTKNEIYLYGSVGMSWWDEDYFTAKTVRDALAGMSGPVTVRINSGGGIAMEGQAIYTLLSDYPDQVDVVIDGVAASAASLIAMAGQTITMRLGSYMLVHDAALGWTEGRGTEEDHIRTALQLDVVSNALADVYARRAGISRDEARAIMKAETFMDGPAAVGAGFATHYDDGIAAAAAATFDYRIYANAPAALLATSLGRASVPKEAVMAMMAGGPRPTQKEGITMAKIPATTAAVVEEPSTTVDPIIAAEPAVTPQAPDASMIERARASVITQAVALANLPVTLAQDLITRGVSEAVALSEITTKWKEAGDMDIVSHGRSTATITADARDKFKTGAALALMARANVSGGERNEFSSMSLSELARASIEAAGEKAQFSDKKSMIGRAFTMAGTHTTSDFTEILANVANKAALLGFADAEETFDLWTQTFSIPDFKEMRVVGTSLFPTLRPVGEAGEYKTVTINDRAERMTLATYGELLVLSRQAVINDDLSMLGRLPQAMGRAAKATIGNLVYGVLTTNPIMSDSVALFHATHANLAGAGTALSVASIGAGRAAMRTQASAGQVLNIAPKFLIVPAALELTAQQLIASAVDPTLTRGMAQNPIQNSMTVVTEGRLDAASATAWYLAAGKNFDTVAVGYLDGNSTPYLEQQEGFNTDGVTMKVRIDAVAKATAWTGLYRNPGA